MVELEPYKHGYYLWKYMPSLAAAVIFGIMFLGTTVMHFIKIKKWRSRFGLPFAIGGVFEVIGYAARAIAHFHTGSIMPYSIQNVLILLGPVLFAASIYMTLGLIIRNTGGEHYSLIPIRWLTKTFVTGDVVSFMIQGSGAGLMATGSNGTMGKNIVVTGLVVQVLMFGFFMATAVVFQMRMHRHPTPAVFEKQTSWRTHLNLLYGVSIMIMIRSIFRVVEFVMGNDGYPLTHEWTLYIFDASLMWLAMLIWIFWYPGKLSRPDMGLELLSSTENFRTT